MQGMRSYIATVYKSSFRRVVASPEDGLLARELNLMDVTFLSVGNSIGMGSYILIGQLSASVGPALVITTALTAGLTIISALCYADFIRRENSSGGAYSCTYIKVGEVHAAVVGCALCAEHIISTALAARGISLVIDRLCGNVISKHLKDFMAIESPILLEYPDAVGFLIPIVSLAIVSYNVKTVTNIINLCCLSNLGLFTLIILVTGSNLDFKNWSLPPSPKCGDGGFIPYGVKSVFHGMADAYNIFVGFDAAGNAGAEVKDPERIIPLAIITATIMVSVLYILNVFTYTLVWPFCDQHIDNPIPDIMKNLGLDIMKWITAVGLPIGLFGNFICNTYPTSRLIYALAEDGLLYRLLAKMDLETKSPTYAVYTTGILTGLFALLLETMELVQLACLGAMTVYSLTSYCLLVLNYSDEVMEYGSTARPLYKIILNLEHKADVPTIITSTIVRICCWIIFLTSYPIFMILRLRYSKMFEGGPFEMFILASLFLFYLLITVVIFCQPLSKNRLSKMKVVPVLPVCVILINTYLSMEYSLSTWIHGFLWLFVGFLIYITYGVWHSRAGIQKS